MFSLTISMEKIEAIDLLTKHRLHHITEYERAMIGWEKSMDQYSRNLNMWAANGGEQKDRPQEPRRPDSYKEQYDKLLAMLDYHSKSTLDVDEEDFDKIVLDKFNWSQVFLTTNAFYKSI